MVDPRHSKLRLCSLLQKLEKTLAMSCQGLKSTDIFYQLLCAMRIAPVAIIDRQLPFEYTIASRSTDVMVWNAVYDAHNQVAGLKLGSMTSELHRQFENSSPYEMLQELKSMFEKQAGVERFDLIHTFLLANKKRENYNFARFVKNYNMHNMGKTIGELHALLIEYEKGKGKGKGKGKDKRYIHKPKNPKPYAKEHLAKDDACHHYKEVGLCKRKCPAYLAELIKKKKQVGTASSSGIFTIELFSFPNKSWVYDIGCGTHICNTKQGLRGERKLKQGALYLCVGNGVRAQVEAIESDDLVLPNGLVICLDNFSKNYVLCFNAIPSDVVMVMFIYLNINMKSLKHSRCLRMKVENQLGKTIKALRSDQGGEYISQEFKDYLKACGIVQKLTSSYTPQHNGVSKRRNRTLLDMLRSIKNLHSAVTFWE
ncbi:retrotransposon protein, putative, ty1-copia subclass [Tanacetum coccineum]